MADLPERRIDDRQMRGPIICSSSRSATRLSKRSRNSRMVAINWRTSMVGRELAVALEIIVGIWAFVAKNS